MVNSMTWIKVPTKCPAIRERGRGSAGVGIGVHREDDWVVLLLLRVERGSIAGAFNHSEH